ncbi:SH3 domain-containing protein [Rhizobium sp. P32RR-XVIII]|uniref:SH3 domain-containing protein n=1 Tax=Rhizobium sp. P32RR-XVIII TaxID=2726738 RepID=UPI0014566264|nr:SH3 domain-containing protein [Rhizobium sp. P32RR-XVIII]NLS01831.1 SH3 domain-containing protein [Rhizobium sp. P32RR-XVIII]
MKTTLLKIAAAGMLLLAPAIAQAAEGFATANVNMRAGPSTGYPAVAVIPAGESVEIYGCLADAPWCDVEFYGGRGWVHGRYVQAVYQERRVYLGPEYYRPLGIPVVVFSFGNYWDRHYRNRDFYRYRDRWSRGPNVYRGPSRGPDFESRPGPGRRPDLNRELDRRPGFNRSPGISPDFGSPERRDFNRPPERSPNIQRRLDSDRPQNFGRGFERRPDVDTGSDRGRRQEFDRDRREFQRQDNGGNRNRGGDGGRPRRPVCPGDPACRD